MTQELLRQLASGGLQALPPERLEDLAQWCLEWTEATGDGRYSVLAQVLTQLRSWFGGDEGRGAAVRLVLRADMILSRELPGLLNAPTSQEGAAIAATLRDEIMLLQAEAGDTLRPNWLPDDRA